MDDQKIRQPLLRVEDLAVSFDAQEGEFQAVRGVSLDVEAGETLAIVGESGSGKTVLCHAVAKLLPHTARIRSGRIIIDGQDVTKYSERQMRALRGRVIAHLFQDPMTTLNPTMTIGRQITESLRLYHRMTTDEARAKAAELLRLVGIEEADRRLDLMPHCFSGGQRQRCVLAIALALGPRLLFADEPTTSLDVTVQAGILDLLRSIQRQTGLAVVFVSHDLGVVARIADRVAVMYAGRIVEVGTADEIFYDPRHPYTWALLGSLPALAIETGELHSIPGMPPAALDPPPGDAFASRNEYALAIDYEQQPPMFSVSATHKAATWLLDPRAPRVEPPEWIRRRREQQ